MSWSKPSRERIKANIRKLPTDELKTYRADYRAGRVYKFALTTAEAELKRRKMNKSMKRMMRRKPVQRNPWAAFGGGF